MSVLPHDARNIYARVICSLSLQW